MHRYLEEVDYLPGLGRIYKNRDEALYNEALAVLNGKDADAAMAFASKCRDLMGSALGRG